MVSVTPDRSVRARRPKTGIFRRNNRRWQLRCALAAALFRCGRGWSGRTPHTNFVRQSL